MTGKLFGRKKGVCKILHNKEIRYMYRTPSIVRIVKFQKVTIAVMGKQESNAEVKEMGVNIKTNLREESVGFGGGWIWFRITSSSGRWCW